MEAKLTPTGPARIYHLVLKLAFDDEGAGIEVLVTDGRQELCPRFFIPAAAAKPQLEAALKALEDVGKVGGPGKSGESE